jgi:hypothetical protein
MRLNSMAALYNRFQSFRDGRFGVILFLPEYLLCLRFAVDSYLFSDPDFCQTFRGKSGDPVAPVNIGIDFIAVLGLFKNLL